MAVGDERGRWKRRRGFVTILAPAALASVLLAIAGGASRARWLPVAEFLAVAVSANTYFWVGLYAERRRAGRLRQVEVAFGVRHDAPLWTALVEPSMAVGFGAAIAAISGALGFPGVGVGVLLMFLVIAGGMSFFKLRMSPRGLTFEASGLRVHVGVGSFLVPWAAIAGVDRIGPDHMQMIQLRLADADTVIASHEPKTDRMRARVESAVDGRGAGGGRMMLWPGAGGFDGATIARTIDRALRGGADRVN